MKKKEKKKEKERIFHSMEEFMTTYFPEQSLKSMMEFDKDTQEKTSAGLADRIIYDIKRITSPKRD